MELTEYIDKLQDYIRTYSNDFDKFGIQIADIICKQIEKLKSPMTYGTYCDILQCISYHITAYLSLLRQQEKGSYIVLIDLLVSIAICLATEYNVDVIV